MDPQYPHSGGDGVEIDPALNIRSPGSSADSSYESHLGSYTTSLASNVSDFRFTHGRRYHSDKDEAYIYPNDEAEQDRLDIIHQLLQTSMKNQLHRSPLKAPKRILDIGTGTGIWAMEIGDKFPEADVLGNDLSPIQPRWVPPNVHFEIDDVTKPWTYSTPFDFIHCCTMSTAIRDWPKLISECFEHLAPGGYAEFIDFDGRYTSPDGTLVDGSDINKLNKLFIETALKSGMDPSPGPHFEKWLKDAGFEDVKAERLPLPIGVWAADENLKTVGAWNYLMLNEGVEGIVNYLFAEHLSMSKEEIMIACAKIRKQLKDPGVHSMYFLHIVYGRKPDAK